MGANFLCPVSKNNSPQPHDRNRNHSDFNIIEHKTPPNGPSLRYDKTNSISKSKTITTPSELTALKHDKTNSPQQLSPLSLKPSHSRVETLSEMTEFHLNEILRDVLDDTDGSINDINSYAKQMILGNEKDKMSEYRIDIMLKDIRKQDKIYQPSNESIPEEQEAEEEKEVKRMGDTLSIDSINDSDIIDKIKEVKSKYKHERNKSSLTEIIIQEFKINNSIHTHNYTQWQQRISNLVDWVEIDEPLIPSVYHEKQSKLHQSKAYLELRNTTQKQMSKLLQHKKANELRSECMSNKCAAGKIVSEIFDKCECIKRIQLVLQMYQMYMRTDALWRKAAFGSILCSNTTKYQYGIQQLMDDFFHIKDIHVDNDNENRKNVKFICETLERECKCDIEVCPVYRRHNRERTNDDKEKQLYFRRAASKTQIAIDNKEIVFLQFCDMFHSYFLHSTVKYGNEIEDIAQIKIDLPQRKNIHYLGRKEDELWWKQVNIEKQSDADIYRTLIKSMGVFRYQSAHGFRPGQNQGLSQLKPRFANVKDEALYNRYYAISKDNWNQTLRKSKLFCQSWASHKIRTTHSGNFCDQYTGQKSKWSDGMEIKLQEIVILKLYTDYDKLQFEAKKCFRFDAVTDVMDDDVGRTMSVDYDLEIASNKNALEERLSDFYHWSSGLKLVLNKFGAKLNGNNLYHGVNTKMLINTAATYSFYGPLSTSSSIHVARTFATEKGMVLKIASQFPRLSYCNAFNASLISDYPEESEWLIGFMYVRLLKVITKQLHYNINQIALASYMRMEFFVIHLFRQQIFSMNDELAIILEQFLKCSQMECCTAYRNNDNNNQNDSSDLKTNENYKLKYLCCNVAKHENEKKTNIEALFTNENRIKYKHGIKKAEIIFKIIWKKFNEFRKCPNRKQCVKFDNISNVLKRFFMIKDEEKYISSGENKWNISFNRIINIYPNIKEIHFLNSYKFDDKLLKNLIKQINNQNQLEMIKFLYYHYDKANTSNQPINGDIFINPNNLNKELLKELGELNWKIKHQKNGETGYKIRVFRSK